jgi:integrase
MTPLQIRREAVVRVIAEHLATVGARDWGEVQAQLPDLPPATFWRYVRRAKRAARAGDFVRGRVLEVEPSGGDAAPQRATSREAQTSAERTAKSMRQGLEALVYAEAERRMDEFLPSLLAANARWTYTPVRRHITVAELLPLYESAVLSQHRRGKSELRSLSRVCLTLMNKRCADVGYEELEDITNDMARDAPVHANRARGYFSAMFAWARRQGYTDYNPAVDAQRPTEESRRDRSLSLSEIVEVWQATEELGRPFGPAIRMMILTVARREEVASMRKEDVQRSKFGFLEWTVMVHKRGGVKPFTIPLSFSAEGIFEHACQASPPSSPLVFTTTGSTPVSGWSRAKRRLDEIIHSRQHRADPNASARMPAWRFNDLRRSFFDVAQENLVADCYTLGLCLNRLSDLPGAVLKQMAMEDDQFELRQEALFDWADLIEERAKLAAIGG